MRRTTERLARQLFRDCWRQTLTAKTAPNTAAMMASFFKGTELGEESIQQLADRCVRAAELFDEACDRRAAE